MIGITQGLIPASEWQTSEVREQCDSILYHNYDAIFYFLVHSIVKSLSDSISTINEYSFY